MDKQKTKVFFYSVVLSAILLLENCIKKIDNNLYKTSHKYRLTYTVVFFKLYCLDQAWKKI